MNVGTAVRVRFAYRRGFAFAERNWLSRKRKIGAVEYEGKAAAGCVLFMRRGKSRRGNRESDHR